MMHRIAFAVVALCWGVAGAAVTPGDHVRQLSFDQVAREYRLHVPPGYDGSVDVPLVVNIHGFGSNAMQQEILSELLPVADREGFIVVHPEGIDNAWNAGICCGNAQLDDVGFIRTVVADVAAQVRIDPRRIHVTGLSNGGAMSHRLACEATELFAAAAPMAFPIPYDPVTGCQPSRPIAVMTGMGLTDVLVPYDGGLFPSAAATFAQWKTLNACTGTAPDAIVVTGASRCETYTQCDAGVETRLCSITANAFGGTFFDGHVLYINPDLELAEEIWAFLRRFTLPDPPARSVLAGATLLRSGRTRGRDDIAWTVTFDGTTWTAADGAGHVVEGTARRVGKSRTYVLTPTDRGRGVLAAVAAEGFGGGTVTLDQAGTLQLGVDRTGVPVKLKGALRLTRDGAGGRLTIKAKR